MLEVSTKLRKSLGGKRPDKMLQAASDTLCVSNAGSCNQKQNNTIYGEFSWSGELSFRQTKIVPGEGNNKAKCKNNNSKNTQSTDRSAWHGANVQFVLGLSKTNSRWYS